MRTVTILFEKGQLTAEAVNRCTKAGITALDRAAKVGQLAVAELLLERNARVDVRRSDGDTPLHTAASHGRTSICQLLLRNGASANVVSNAGDTPLHVAARRFCPFGLPVKDRIQVIHTLLSAQADPKAVNSDGLTALAIAQKEGFEEYIEAWKVALRSTSKCQV